MRKQNYVVRIFRCENCGGILYAPKCKGKTLDGHLKKMYCPFCKVTDNKIQIGIK